MIKRLYPWELFPVTREETSKKEDGKIAKKRSSRQEAGGVVETHPVVESLHKFGITTSAVTNRKISDVKRVSDVEADVVVAKNGSTCTVRVRNQENMSNAEKYVLKAKACPLCF